MDLFVLHVMEWLLFFVHWTGLSSYEALILPHLSSTETVRGSYGAHFRALLRSSCFCSQHSLCNIHPFSPNVENCSCRHTTVASSTSHWPFLSHTVPHSFCLQTSRRPSLPPDSLTSPSEHTSTLHRWIISTVKTLKAWRHTYLVGHKGLKQVQLNCMFYTRLWRQTTAWLDIMN